MVGGVGLTDVLWIGVVFLALSGAADMVSAAYRSTILQVAAPDELRGRLQGVFIVVVAGGPRAGDFLAGSVASGVGERVALIKFENGPAAAADGRGGAAMFTEPLVVRAGQHKVAAAFVKKLEGPYEDLVRPHDWSYAGGGAGGAGITTLPHLRDMIIRGPYSSMGVSESPSRKKIFTCRPTALDEEKACAESIVRRLGTLAFRRPVNDRDFGRLMALLRSRGGTAEQAGTA